MSNPLSIAVQVLIRTGIALALTLASTLMLASTRPVSAAGTTVTVTTTTDELNADGDCSLREAVQATNTNAPVDACPAGSATEIDTIVLGVGTYTLSVSGDGDNLNATGDLDVWNGGSLEVRGDPYRRTVISGAFSDRVFHLISADLTLELTDLVIRDGLTLDEPGGGVLAWGRLSLTRVTVEGNGVLGSTGQAYGGGVCVGCQTGTGQLFMNDSIVRSNSATNDGGVMLATGTSGVIERSSIVQNSATQSGGGLTSFGTLDLRTSLVSDNTAAAGSSGALNYGTLVIVNATISHNTGNGAGVAGGLYSANLATTTLSNVLLGANVPGNCGPGTNVVSNGHNLSSDASCAARFTAGGDLNSTDPQLLPLQTSGHVLVRPVAAASPAVDAAEPTICPVSDIRNLTRGGDGNGDGSAGCDIGALEYRPRFHVNGAFIWPGPGEGDTWSSALSSLQDALSYATPGTSILVRRGVYYPDVGGFQVPDDRRASFVLRDGVNVYGGYNGTETSFKDGDVAANPTVLSGDITQDDLDTDGNQVAESQTDIRGSNSLHVVRVQGPAGGVFSGFSITGGQADGGTSPDNIGGGILNQGSSFVFSDLLISGNTAAGGGGMLNDGGVAILDRVLFVGNNATFGGGLQNNAGANVWLTTVTFSGNTGGFGGAVFNAASNPLFVHVTIANNTGAAGAGGGIHNTGSAPVLTSTLIANNQGGDCINVNGSSIGPGSSDSLIRDSASACGLVTGVNGHVIGRDPLLGPLPLTGGPYRTHPLQAGSPAVDAAPTTLCPSVDQRLVTRPQGARCDIGAFELNRLFLPHIRK